MDGCTALLVAVALFWGALEGGLILRDRRKGRSSTDLDGRTRAFNFASMIFSPSMAAVVTWVPIVRDLGVRSRYVFAAGIGIMVIGLSLRLWSIVVLGRFFRTTIGLDKDQQLVERGPYHYIRHPSYSGLLLTCLGYGIALQNMASLVIVVTLPTMALLQRIRMEEAFLVSALGASYESYRKRSKRLIPGIW